MNCFNISGDASKVFRRVKLVPVILLGFSTLLFTTGTSADELVVNGSFEDPDLTTFPVDSRAIIKGWTTFYGQNYRPEICTDNGWEVECNDDALLPGWSVWWTDSILMTDPVTGELVGNPAPDVAGRIEIQGNKLPDRVNPKKMAENIAIEAFNAALPPGEEPLPLIPLISYAKSGDQKAEMDSHDRRDPVTGNVIENNNVSLNQGLLTCVGHPYTLTYNWRSRTTVPGDNDVRVVIADTIVRSHELTADWVTESVSFVAKDPTTFLAFISIGTGTTEGMSLDDVSVIGPTPDALGECPPPPGECESCESVPVGWVDPNTCEECVPWEPEYTSSGSLANGCGLCEIKGKFSSLTFLYDGDDISSHGQSGDKPVVDPDPSIDPLPIEAVIRVSDDKKDGEVLYSGSVFIGETFEFSPVVARNGKQTNSLKVEIFDGSVLVQTLRFHISCSQPFDLMDSFGGITLWDAVKQ